MNRLLSGVAAIVIAAGALSTVATTASAQPGHWRQGGRIERGDWNRGRPIDYRSAHLRAPPRGYEWRRVDNNYVLAAAATGLIASVIVAGR